MREHRCYPEKTNFRECMDFYFQVSTLMSGDDINFDHFFMVVGGITKL